MIWFGTVLNLKLEDYFKEKKKKVPLKKIKTKIMEKNTITLDVEEYEYIIFTLTEKLNNYKFI